MLKASYRKFSQLAKNGNDRSMCKPPFHSKSPSLPYPSSPSLLLIDDLHVLAPHKDHTPSEAERRATAALGSLLDQLHTASGYVIVVATTNQIEGVEPSLRRPGRFGKQVDIPVPSVEGRREVGGAY